MKINEKTLRALEQIAMESDYNLETRGGLETRNNDEEDFPEISVWGLRKMLEHAYLLGRMDAEKGRCLNNENDKR